MNYTNEQAERDKALELMGVYGYCREYDIEKHWRDIRAINLFMGSSQLDYLTVARYFWDIEVP